MLTREMNDKLNAQITHEFYSSYLYRQMASWFAEKSLTVLEQWYLSHAAEEQAHAVRLIGYVQKAGGHLELGQIAAPPHEFSSPLAIAKLTLEHERGVTALIHKLVAQAELDKDYSTRSSLQWYIDEQVEEEATVSELVALTEMAKDHWLMLEDRIEKMAARKQATETT